MQVEQIVGWGVDSLKVDGCQGMVQLGFNYSYPLVGEFIKAAGEPISALAPAELRRLSSLKADRESLDFERKISMKESLTEGGVRPQRGRRGVRWPTAAAGRPTPSAPTRSSTGSWRSTATRGGILTTRSPAGEHNRLRRFLYLGWLLKQMALCCRASPAHIIECTTRNSRLLSHGTYA